jgi:sugar/nucleoside kinase (ribokinase family)
MTTKYDIVGIGNAIVDILSHTEDNFLARENLHKGSMSLIDEDRAHHIYNVMQSTTVISGGSAANTIVGASQLGTKCAFIGKVKNDDLGHIFEHDLKSIGITYQTPHAHSGPSTARCYVLITPDGERTMNTYLGASQHLGENDVDEQIIKNTSIVYLEGYLWDPPEAKKAFLKASDLAHHNNGKVAFTLSDQFCVDRYRDEFVDLLVSKRIDILFANEHELKSLFVTEDIKDALHEIQKIVPLAVVTRSKLGSVIITNEDMKQCPAQPIQQLVDTTGAGDLFASGFLAGLIRQMDLEGCAHLGAMAASEIIQHIGARPETNLLELAQANGFIDS